MYQKSQSAGIIESQKQILTEALLVTQDYFLLTVLYNVLYNVLIKLTMNHLHFTIHRLYLIKCNQFFVTNHVFSARRWLYWLSGKKINKVHPKSWLTICILQIATMKIVVIQIDAMEIKTQNNWELEHFASITLSNVTDEMHFIFKDVHN